jgi:hypothetical protein
MASLAKVPSIAPIRMELEKGRNGKGKREAVVINSRHRGRNYLKCRIKVFQVEIRRAVKNTQLMERGRIYEGHLERKGLLLFLHIWKPSSRSEDGTMGEKYCT